MNKLTSATRPITESIAWLSVVLLAGAWGAEAGPGWQSLWLNCGLMGLVSAVGLSYVSRGEQAKHAGLSQAECDAALLAEISFLVGKPNAPVCPTELAPPHAAN